MLHAAITLLIGGCLYPLNLHMEGLAMAALFYCGREHAQAEYRCIVTHYGNHRASAPWWCGFEPRAWDRKSVMDWLLPLLMALLASFIGGDIPPPDFS